MNIRTLRKRVNKLIGVPVPAEHAAKAAALVTLREATVNLCGPDRQQWFQRVAKGRATVADEEVLAALPADALEAAGLTGIEYMRLMHRVLTDF